jgi:hypothetical protein
MAFVFGRSLQPLRASRSLARLSLEALEARWCPSRICLDGLTPPRILGFAAGALPGHMALLSGSVDDPNPAGLTVNFDGTVSGSTTCDANGNFSYLTSDAALGSIMAVASDSAGLCSGRAWTILSVPPPILTLTITYGSQRTVTLAGQVTDLDAAGRTVTFSGVVSGSAVTGADGKFTLTTQASALGNVQSSTVDLWGQSSNTAQVTVASAPPVISNLTVYQANANTWVITGSVADESAAGLVIQFSGLASLAGKTAVVGANGTFSLTFQLQPGEQGEVYAQTADWWGLNSNQAGVWA